MYYLLPEKVKIKVHEILIFARCFVWAVKLVTLREESKLRMLENSVLRRVF